MFFLGELSDEIKHAFFDPVKGRFDAVEIFELKFQVQCLSSGYGWLLLLSRDTSSLFFFNPLTHQKIQLPYRKSIFNAVAFSAPPTSPNCTVYAVTMPIFNDKLFVDTFCLDKDKQWLRHTFKPTSLECNNLVQAVCSNGVLYCVDASGRVTIFDHKDNSWTRVPSCAKDKAIRVCNQYLVEIDGEIYAAKKGPYGVLQKVYKLKLDDDVTH